MTVPLPNQGPIFDPITMPWSCGEETGDDNNGAAAAAHYVSTCWTVYLAYKDPTKDAP